MKRIERIRLYPSARQEQALRFMLDVTRQLYNAALQERRDAYRMGGVSVTHRMQYAELTALRKPGLGLDLRLAAVYREGLSRRTVGGMRHSIANAPLSRCPQPATLTRNGRVADGHGAW